MNINQQLLYMDRIYQILYAEQEIIIHPAALGLLPVTLDNIQLSFDSTFSLNEYQLMLDQLSIPKYVSGILDTNHTEASSKLYEFSNLSISYNGTILIGNDLVKEYNMRNIKPACFSYRNVIELVFEDGILITTIDQSKAMQRIRKNIELGLRSLTKSRDIRCIRRFMNSSFVGDYHSFITSKKRLHYIKDMKNEYLKKEVSFSEKN